MCESGHWAGRPGAAKHMDVRERPPRADLNRAFLCREAQGWAREPRKGAAAVVDRTLTGLEEVYAVNSTS